MDQYYEIVSKAARAAEEMMRDNARRGIFQPIYFYFRPGKGELVPFTEATSPNPGSGWELAHPEGLRVNVPYSQFWTWIHDRNKRTPCLKV